MFCPNCGTQLADTAKFCANCGHRMVSAQPAPQTPADPEPQPVPVYEAPKPTPVYKAPEPARKKKKSALPVVIIALVLIAAIGAGLWFFVFNAKQTMYLVAKYEYENSSSGYSSNNTLKYEYDEDGNLLAYAYEYSYASEYYDDKIGYDLSYEYDKKGNIIAAKLEGDEDTIELEYVYEKGVLVEVVGEGDDCEVEASCSKNGLIESLEIKYEDGTKAEYTYEYDKEGNLEEKVFKSGSSKTVSKYENGRMVDNEAFYDGESTSRTKWVYDENGNTLEYEYFYNGESQNRYVYEYDAKNNQIRQDYYYQGELGSSLQAETEYDEDNMLCGLEVWAKGSDGEKTVVDCEVERDGLEVTITMTSKEQESEAVIELEYDEDGHVLEMRVLEEGEEIMSTSREYDEHGNLLEEVQSTTGGATTVITYKYIEVKVPKDYVKFNANDPIWFVGIVN